MSNMPWKRRQAIPDAQVRDAADQYEAASRILWTHWTEGVLLPFLNMSVMSVELYLKSLSSRTVHVPQDDGGSLVYAEPDVRKHPPSKLLNAIPTDVRQKMETEYAKRPQSEGMSLADRCATYDELFSHRATRSWRTSL